MRHERCFLPPPPHHHLWHNLRKSYVSWPKRNFQAIIRNSKQILLTKKQRYRLNTTWHKKCNIFFSTFIEHFWNNYKIFFWKSCCTHLIPENHQIHKKNTKVIIITRFTGIANFYHFLKKIIRFARFARFTQNFQIQMNIHHFIHIISTAKRCS